MKNAQTNNPNFEEVNAVFAVTSDGVQPFKNYTLIYKCSGHNQSAKRVVSGMKIQMGLENLRYNAESFGLGEQQFRSAFLMPTVEAWGRHSLGLPFPAYIPSDVRKMVKKAAKHCRKEKAQMEMILNMYMAHHVGRYANALTLVVTDTSVLEKPSLDIYLNAADWIKKTMTYDEFCHQGMIAGTFILGYPTIEELNISNSYQQQVA